MEGMLPPTDQERLVSSFLLFARGQTAATARNFLQATNWKRDEALELYLSGTARGLKDEKQLSRKIEQETRRPGVWESGQGDTSLASLYCPPFHLMFNGSFNQAKIVASVKDKWLLVNIQSTEEFSSHMLNRDTWANDAVSQIISTNFIFWQVYDDTSEGQKFCTNYGLDSIPVALLGRNG